MCRLVFMVFQLIEIRNTQEQLKMIGYQCGTRSSVSHWEFLNWLFYTSKLWNVIFLEAVTLADKHVYLSLNSDKAFVRFVCATARANFTSLSGFSSNFTFFITPYRLHSLFLLLLQLLLLYCFLGLPMELLVHNISWVIHEMQTITLTNSNMRCHHYRLFKSQHWRILLVELAS